jgi:Tol biopolymer transport system component
MAPMGLSAGARFGTYEILAPLGAGGMGEVYRARDTRLKRDVALKVLQGTWVDIGDRIARFEREAELLAAVNHPNIAAIYGIEESAGITALVLELVDGPTLADRLAHGAMPLPEIIGICRQIVDALDAAHERGIVHRDLKPANIKLRQDGAVKVLDFGLAKALGSHDGSRPGAAEFATVTSPVLTSLGVILGTAAYMSPEQARGQPIDKRTDIWAFGCVLYEMLAGRTAFARATVPDSIAAILEREPDWSVLPPATPRSMRRLLQRCLDKNRSQRLRDIADVRHALDDVSDDEAPRAETSPSRAGWWRLAAGAVAVAGVAAFATALVMSGRARQTAPGAASPGSRFIRVTSDAAYSTEPALSRDGTMVVYASDRDGEGQLDLWLQRTAGGQPIELTNDAADDREPDFSPDGSLIAFRSDRAGGGVYVMPALGGHARLVAEGGRRPRFSPDSNRIAYWTGPWLSGAGARGPGAVFTVAANGGQPVRLANGFSTARNPVWSPDGQSVLFFGRKAADDSPSGAFDWWWAPLDGREPVPTGAYRVMIDLGIISAGDGDLVARLEPTPRTWTRSGVLFSAGFGESVSVWRLGISPSTGQAVEASLERLTSGAGFDLEASADDSGRIAFQFSSEGYVSLTLPLDANAGRPSGPSGPIVRQTFWARGGGRNSLDDAGRLLAYLKSGANETELWVKDLRTGSERHLVTTRLGNLNPVISHDGSHVAYSVVEGSRAIGHVVPTAGGTARQVCECTLQGWFSDNRRILALDGTGMSHRVRVVDVMDRTEAVLFTHATPLVGRADISPDDRWLTVSSQRYVRIAPARPGNPPDEREWTTILNKPEAGAERACGWSPDGRLLYLLLERDGFRDLYAQRIDPARGTAVGEPFIVQHLHDPRRRWGSTPYGSAIVSNAFVFSQVETTGSIWLLDPGPASRRANRE